MFVLQRPSRGTGTEITRPTSQNIFYLTLFLVLLINGWKCKLSLGFLSLTGMHIVIFPSVVSKQHGFNLLPPHHRHKLVWTECLILNPKFSVFICCWSFFSPLVFILGLCCIAWRGHQPPTHLQKLIITQAGVMLLPFPPPQVIHKFLYYFSNAAENRFLFPLAVTAFKSYALTNSYSSAKKKKKKNKKTGSPLVQSSWKIEGKPTSIQGTGK